MGYPIRNICENPEWQTLSPSIAPILSVSTISERAWNRDTPQQEDTWDTTLLSQQTIFFSSLYSSSQCFVSESAWDRDLPQRVHIMVPTPQHQRELRWKTRSPPRTYRTRTLVDRAGPSFTEADWITLEQSLDSHHVLICKREVKEP